MLRTWLAILVLASISACLDEELQEQAITAQELVQITVTGWSSVDAPNPAAFAVIQEGEGPWTAMHYDGQRYTATINPGRYAVALGNRVRQVNKDESYVYVRHSTTDEQRELSIQWLGGVPLTRYQLLVDIRGTSAGQRLYIGHPGGSSSGRNAINGISTFTAGSPTGELIVALAGGTPSEPFKVTRISNLDLRNSAPVVLDFNLPYPAPTSYPVVIDGSLAHSVSSAMYNAAGRYFPLGGATGKLFALPPSLSRPGDTSHVYGSAYPRSVELIQSGPGPASLQFGPLFSQPVATLRGGYALGLSFPLSHSPGLLPLTDYDYIANSSYGDYQEDYVSVEWTMSFSSGWIGGHAGGVFHSPSFNGVSGWTADMALPYRAPIYWQAIRTDLNTRTSAPGQMRHTSSAPDVTLGEYCGNGIVEQRYETCDPPNGTTCSSSCSNM